MHCCITRITITNLHLLEESLPRNELRGHEANETDTMYQSPKVRKSYDICVSSQKESVMKESS